MKNKRKYVRRVKPVDSPIAPGNSSPAPTPAPAPAPESYTSADLQAGAAQDLQDKPKRKYTRRQNADSPQIDFGNILAFAGQTVAKLASMITRQDSPLTQGETEMLDLIGKSCGEYLVNENSLAETAPKYAKYLVIGGLGLVAGVRALDYFLRPRLNSGAKSSIAYDVSPRVTEIPNNEVNLDGIKD